MDEGSRSPYPAVSEPSPLAATASSIIDPLGSDHDHPGQRPGNFQPSPPCDNFGVAIICALPLEAKAVLALFEEQWDGAGLDTAPTDTNSYSVGSITSHPVVLAHMHSMGKVAAATVAGNLRASFRSLRLVLVVGICGGAPNASKAPSDGVFLGDVVVSTGVIQYDLGRRFPGRFVRKDTPHDNLSRLSVVADGLLAKLKATEAGHGSEFSRSVARHLDTLQQRLGSESAYPGRGGDQLFQPDYLHKHHEPSECLICAENADAVCDEATDKNCEALGCSQRVSNLVSRSPPEHRLQPTVHFGLVASGDTVMRSGRDRDEIARRDGVIAFEMEGAGCWEILRECSCLIIKSVCDYADSHKNKMFQGYAAVVAAATAKVLLESWDAHKPDSLRPLPSTQPFLGNGRPDFSVEAAKLLGRLKTVTYQDRKDRNPDRIPGTCEWFVSHRLFNNWLAGSQGKGCQALWVSADPGCGKSVLAKYLVDHVLPSTQSRTTCYFFFKDDFEDQKSAANAMCCILHQLFTHNPVLFSAEVRTQLEAEGKSLTVSFRTLWELLLKVAGEKNAGDIICILDALDECVESDRQLLARALLDQHRTKKAPNLKFLLTSRPFGTIRRDFQPSDTEELAVVHLSGENEEEVKQISKEIDIFIEARVRGVGAKLRLDKDEQDMLLRGLLNVPHRTYLWVYLTLNSIESDESISKRKISQALSRLPSSVDEAYEKILLASSEPKEARRALHIIVAAERPLTVREMNFALAIRSSHQSYQDVDLDSDQRFRDRLRSICGLFVVIIDSKIYLLHQTAKEFLVVTDSQQALPKAPGHCETKSRWKHSLEPIESHQILGEICLWHLRFPELFESTPELMNNARRGFNYTAKPAAELRLCLRAYDFLEYSAYFWSLHLRALHTGVDKKMTQAMLDICHACHQHRQWWFRATTGDEPKMLVRELWPPSIIDDSTATPLMIASYFGLVPAVQAFVKADRRQLFVKDLHNRTALAWAATCGHADVVRVLIDSQPKVYKRLRWLGSGKRSIVNAVDDRGVTPLLGAIDAGSADTVRLLLENGADTETRERNEDTPLLMAVRKTMEPDIIRLFLKRGACVETSNWLGETPLVVASGLDGAVNNIQLLLQSGAKVDRQESWGGRTPLLNAIFNNCEDNVNLLLEAKPDLGLRDRKGDTAFTLACVEGLLDTAKLLLKRGVDIEERGEAGRSALCRACEKGQEAVARFLVEQGADIESRCNNEQTPLYYCLADHSDRNDRGSLAKFLLDNGADLEAKDSDGASILANVARSGSGDGVEWLLENGADLESQNLYGETPLVWATKPGPILNVVKILLRAGVNANVTTRDGESVLQLVIAYYIRKTHISESPFAHDTHIKRLIAGLLDRGADIEHRDKEGRTALSLAAGCDKLWAPRIVTMLLAKGADINSKDSQGRTPLFWATAHPFGTDIVRALIAHGATMNDVDTKRAVRLARRGRKDLFG